MILINKRKKGGILVNIRKKLYQLRLGVIGESRTVLCRNETDELLVDLVSARLSVNMVVPSVVILNENDTILVNASAAILLDLLIREVNRYGKTGDVSLEIPIASTVKRMKRIYPRISKETLKKDIWKMIMLLFDIADGKKTCEMIGNLSEKEVASYWKNPYYLQLGSCTIEGKEEYNLL